MSISTFNRRWASVLLEALSRHNITDICIAPGSRSTPLILEASLNNKFTCHTHFDERGLAFMALGLAKIRCKPVAVIVTSGTAVANLYPALIEAGLTGEQLVLLTADRPPELINCGANQAIRQHDIFASHPTCSLQLPKPTFDIPARWLVSAIDDAMHQLEFGALHINCPFAEPLYGEKTDDYLEWTMALGDWWENDQCWLTYTFEKSVTQQLDWLMWRSKKGVIVTGRLSPSEGIAVASWAAELGWPVLSDIQSSTGQPFPYADLWLSHRNAQEQLSQAELVIQFGAHLTGKRLLQWQSNCSVQEYWLVDMRGGRLDPAHHFGRRIIANIEQWLLKHPVETPNCWADNLNQLTEQCHSLIDSHLSSSFSEAFVAHHLPLLLPEHGQLFVGNSLIVRLIDALAQLPCGYPVLSNRGASGIDGLIATSIGVAKAGEKPTLAIMGDISALYDLNSLALLASYQNSPFVLLVINNNGGSIFSLLPTPEKERERFYRMPHGFSFEHAALMFGLDYSCPKSWQQLNDDIKQTWRNGGVLLVELKVPEHEGAEILRTLVGQASQLPC